MNHTVNVTEDILFHLLPSNITNCLIILFSLRGNIQSNTAKQMSESVSIFDMLHYGKYYTNIIICVFVQCLLPFFTDLTMENFFFREGKPASSRYQNAVFCGEHRFSINAQKCLIFYCSNSHGWQHCLEAKFCLKFLTYPVLQNNIQCQSCW